MINIQNSLSRKILFVIGVSFLVLNIFLHGGINLLNKQTFYKLEGEKADLIVQNYAPQMAVQLYLGMEEKLSGLTDQILKNESVLKVSVFNGRKIVLEKAKLENVDGIKVFAPMYKPNSKIVVGKLQIIYSTKQYEELMHQYLILMTLAMVAIIFVFLALNRYIKKLLKPLKNLASMLRDYSPEVDTKIPYLDEQNEIGLISNALNISHQKTVEYATNLQNLNETLEEKVQEKTEALQKQLFTEPITLLPNRSALIDTLEKSSKDSMLVILCLDNYKEINTFYGYAIGDSLLRATKDKIIEIFHNSEYKLFKLPGREFALYSEKSESKMVFSAILNELANVLNKNTFFISDLEINITFTIGASIAEEPLFEKADIALQEAYKTKQPVVIYNSTYEIEQKIDNNIQMIKKIKNAIKDDRIVPYFQPLYDNKTGKIKSYESLVRLVEEDGKVLSPYFFLEIAQKAKLYKQIARIMINKSCKTFQGTPYDFSLNFEIDDVLDEQLVEFTMDTMQRYGVSKQVTFEILESESIEDIDAITKFTKLVSSQGCKISIDDFGSGYSNFLHLLKLNADYLKIDGSLIKNIHQDSEARIIVKSIVTFAKELGLKTVAEFVHCQEVYAEVQNMGIDFSQGYLLGEPKPELVEEKELALA
jgi:diguanylate cyclase (GGDEF)-like protein